MRAKSATFTNLKEARHGSRRRSSFYFGVILALAGVACILGGASALALTGVLAGASIGARLAGALALARVPIKALSSFWRPTTGGSVPSAASWVRSRPILASVGQRTFGAHCTGGVSHSLGLAGASSSSPKSNTSSSPYFSHPSCCGHGYACHCSLSPGNAACDVLRARLDGTLVETPC